jgi:hypothetical protein
MKMSRLKSAWFLVSVSEISSGHPPAARCWLRDSPRKRERSLSARSRNAICTWESRANTPATWLRSNQPPRASSAASSSAM